MSVNGAQTDRIGAEAKLPAILKFSEEVLLRIFMMNTHNTRMPAVYMNSDFMTTSYVYDPSTGRPVNKNKNPRPLEHTRFSSQVCRRWRTILLSSTSIWGRLIDFYSFNNFSHHWRDEVIRRSGSSLLWIVGGENCMILDRTDLPDSDDEFDCGPDQLFFWNFLQANWERTEKLFINGWSGKDFSFLWRPAPNLKALHCYSTPYLGTRGNPDDIFAHHAPRLISFRTHGGRVLPNAQCMSNIRDLALGGSRYRNRLKNREVMELLALLPHIETLDLRNHKMVDDYLPPVVHLPQLRILSLVNCIDYLHTIKPGRKCSFIVSTTLDAFMPNRSIHLEALASIYNEYLDLGLRDKITLKLSESAMSLSAGSLLEFDLPDRDVFALSIKSSQANATGLVALLEPFISPRVSELPFYPIISIPNETWQQPVTLSVIKNFLSPFTSTEAMRLNKDTFDILFAEEHVAPILFPRLRSLTLLDPGNELEKLLSFLDSRRKHGVPIEKVNMLPLDNGISSEDRHALEEHKGMIFRYYYNYQHREFVCGSGHPEI